MRPTGDSISATPRGTSASRDLTSPGAGPLEGKREADVLPLRLSVAPGGLGVELSRPIQVGALVCQQLEVQLLGVSYPVDLSKGVKQFKSRRSELRGALVSVDLEQVARLWAEKLAPIWEETVSVRLFAGASCGSSRGSSGSSSQSANQNDGLEGLSVCLHSTSGVLAFDLVLASGLEPRLIVDHARSLGFLPFLKQRTALQAALAAVDLGLSAAEGSVQVSRSGRAIRVGGLAQALCLSLFPSLGFRMPVVDRQVIVKVGAALGQLSCELAQLKEPFSASFRSLQLGSSADFLHAADAMLAEGNLAEARKSYLKALDLAPGHASILLEIAEIDLTYGERTESAIALLEELNSHNSEGSAVAARKSLLLGAALHQSGRPDAADEAWNQALSIETDPVFFAYLSRELSGRVRDKTRRGQLLDRAVARAPLVFAIRLARLQHKIAIGDLVAARADISQLEAGLTAHQERAVLLFDIAERLSKEGHEGEAMELLRRALRLTPESAAIMVEFARLLEQAGETLRAAELLVAAIRRLEAEAEQALAPDEYQKRSDLLHRCHFRLAKIMLVRQPNSPEVLLHLGSIPTRSARGAEARLLEAEVFQARGNRRDRDHCLGRLVEAVALGWVDAKSLALKAKTVVPTFSPAPDADLIEALLAGHSEIST